MEANHGPAVLQGSLALMPSKVQHVLTEREGEDGKVYGAKSDQPRLLDTFFNF